MHARRRWQLLVARNSFPRRRGRNLWPMGRRLGLYSITSCRRKCSYPCRVEAFCHTSAQTIVHCMSLLHVADHTALGEPSGLYLKRCLSCGFKLELQPLHTLLLTSFALAQYGFDGEDLSGMIACLLCLLSSGAESLRKVAISLSALYGEEQIEECDHEMYDAAQLAEKLHSEFEPFWSEAVTTG
jgi:hypothetical protein